MKIDNSPARGMRDLLPADVTVREQVLESVVAVYRRFGYQRIETPALEDIARLQSGEGGRTRSSSTRCCGGGCRLRCRPVPRCRTWWISGCAMT
jgi:histidyl-tRNA synthetase